MATTTYPRKPILISGAGLASLLLAQSLLGAQIPFLIFEKDASLSFRAQGYRLRLSAEGLDAIESVLGPKDFQTFWDRCGKTGGGGATAIDARTGLKKEFPQPPADEKPTNRVENLSSREGKIVGISRGDMRALFMKGCEAFVYFSHQVTGYELTDSGVRAVFADGSKSVEGEMLVGGEGIYSKVAKQVSGGKLKVYDTGARGIHGQAPSTAFKGLGEGVWVMRDESNPKGKMFVITNVRPGEMDDPDVQFGWTLGSQPGVIQVPNDDYSLVGKPAADIAKALTAEWDPKLRPLFTEMTEYEAAFWKITCSTPSGVPEWKNEPRVTVIGDAVHSMTPAGGIGANTAMRDSALLGKLLADAGGYKEGITEAYEKEMRIYGSEAVKSSYGMAKMQFGVVIDGNSNTV
ncbi:putative zeaxanthin epoxidase, chloroplastic [Mollisia scopiformis]|uniref:Putative zeaxanthin epoxidase, chloroplastic n=1 Tax=Mollisia scopiformis TaxID=149040 RepID=A0A194XGW8_MOLSC|nr:putative zeaxanthin epoxidase, chloroplastic [Mollisia scopiformis]KUJ19418.1 putative zeaxanthin epoxidase, chloroplastic [Mollisia scopiformis]